MGMGWAAWMNVVALLQGLQLPEVERGRSPFVGPEIPGRMHVDPGARARGTVVRGASGHAAPALGSRAFRRGVR